MLVREKRTFVPRLAQGGVGTHGMHTQTHVHTYTFFPCQVEREVGLEDALGDEEIEVVASPPAAQA